MNRTTGERVTEVVLRIDLDDLRQQRDALRREIDSLEQEYDLLEMAISLKESREADVDAADDDGLGGGAARDLPEVHGDTPRPPLRQAILEVMEGSHRPWKRKELLAELDRRGWAPAGKNPANQVGNRLLDLVAAGQAVKIGPGIFALPAKRG